MADRNNKHPENVAGNFYVDNQCIDCDLCRQTAPANFSRNEKNGYTFISKQPSNSLEEELCEKAKKECPIDAIGNDG